METPSFVIAFVPILLSLACASEGSSTGTAGNAGAGGSGLFGSGASGGSGGSQSDGAAASGGTAGSASGGTAGVGGKGGAGGIGGTHAGGAGGFPPIDMTDCETDADCPGGSCQKLTAHVGSNSLATPVGACVYPIVEATGCVDGGGIDECCKSADCGGGKCVLYPAQPMCQTGEPPTPHNVCTKSNCGACGTTSAYVCIPPGAYGYEEDKCAQVWCFKDEDCDALEPGSKCKMIFGACGVVQAISCVLPVIGCQSPLDCDPGQTCVLEKGIPICYP